MSTREWHDLIRPVLPHASTDKETPELGVIRIEPAATAVYAVGTDRYTMAAERWPLTGSDHGRFDVDPVHLNTSDAAASLKLFTYNKDEDPPLRVTIDTAAIPIHVVGQPRTINQLAITIESLDGTRLALHDVRDPSRDPLAGWRKILRAALTRPGGKALEGLDLAADKLARWGTAARKGERLTMYSGPQPGDPLLVVVEKHFAGIWAIPQYLDGPGKTLDSLPWHNELEPVTADGKGRTIDRSTGEVLDGGEGNSGGSADGQEPML